MSQRVAGHDPVAPIDRRGRRKDYFFPGEVAAMLGIEEIEYSRLRTLFALVREQSGATANAGWSRYSLTDVAALRVALDLCGGKEALGSGRHLRIQRVRNACVALRKHGIDNPLLDVKLTRDRDRILADIDGSMFDPATGQTVLTETLRLTSRFVDAREPAAARLLRESQRRPRETRRHAARGQLVVPADSPDEER